MSDEEIYKVDTIPPPPGEDDAYSAPTKVGAMGAAVVEEMIVASVRKAEELNQRALEKAKAPPQREVVEDPEPDGDSLPRVYDERDDEDNAPTVLSDRARPPPLVPVARTPPLGSVSTVPPPPAPVLPSPAAYVASPPAASAPAASAPWPPPPLPPVDAADDDASMTPYFVAGGAGLLLFIVGLMAFLFTR